CAGTGNAIKTASRNKETGKPESFPLDKFNLIIQINLVGTFRCIAKSAAGMLTLDPLEGGDRGAIVNTGSVAAQDGQIGQAAYSASKAGVVGMTLPIARDLSREGIRVNTILPGIFDTPLLAGAPEKVRQALGAQVPYPSRLGNPDEYASLACEMIRNCYFNVDTDRLDGAIRMAPR
ncbi:MAG: SDR family NAD(P)-dependent oxidoreductase, partial [Parvibaculaceae bacterium]